MCGTEFDDAPVPKASRKVESDASPRGVQLLVERLSPLESDEDPRDTKLISQLSDALVLAMSSLGSVSPECLGKLPDLARTPPTSYSTILAIARSLFERFPQRAQRFPKLVMDIVFHNQVAGLLHDDDEVCDVTPRMHALLLLIDSVHEFEFTKASLDEIDALMEKCDALFMELDNPERDPLVF